MKYFGTLFTLVAITGISLATPLTSRQGTSGCIAMPPTTTCAYPICPVGYELNFTCPRGAMCCPLPGTVFECCPV
ncbi:hypothetical protein JAAARDRAFT_30013 [Jaapia argillacea MUCL 33604]|uniref:Granulins domain-containing protein n=1 Tax=Jaapia argillacea MUCL 33604 TaxID=933084 RepID=A0A067Q553_9AGAM|nr:hypothetical protein JAAARDRAFT_30013 [Jaapia argillacea MUCL 33604]